MNDGEPGRRVIDGRFELRARLGGGGMGTVWRAMDLVLHRSVAVKEVRPPDVDLAEYDPQGARLLRERVLREARALARVVHPNVVTIHHVVDGGEGTYPWIVMELVAGGSLAGRLARGPMDPAEAARIGREVLAALRAAHAAGIQHRDVKPANVLLRPDGRPVLTDFGIAAIRESASLTATGSIIGTPDYMAPERVSGKDGGPESDLWSLAMMLYEAVEGRHPMRRGSTLATLAAVLSEPVPPPVQAGPLTDVLMGVLVRDPAARPDAETMDGLLAAVPEDHAGPAPTSYRLTPPPPAPAPAPAPAGFGPAVPMPPSMPQDAVPPIPAAPTPYPGGITLPPQAPVRPSRRGRRIAILSSGTATALVGVLAWTLMPDGSKDDAEASTGSSSSRTPSATSSATGNATPTSGSTSKGTNLLTPQGIRTAIKAIEEKTGSDRFGKLLVYPDYVSAYVMVKGSRTNYDSYTYRVGDGAEKSIISGSLSSGDQPMNLDDFNWDAVPALLAKADKELRVTDPDARYLIVSPPDSTFDDPATMNAYLTDEHDVGYVKADKNGKVIDVYPADG